MSKSNPNYLTKAERKQYKKMRKRLLKEYNDLKDEYSYYCMKARKDKKKGIDEAKAAEYQKSIKKLAKLLFAENAWDEELKTMDAVVGATIDDTDTDPTSELPAIDEGFIIEGVEKPE